MHGGHRPHPDAHGHRCRLAGTLALVRDAFGIDHVTIQVEPEGLECESC